MAQLVVRNLEENVKARLRHRASRHGHSMEEEVRDILRNSVRTEKSADASFGARLRARFSGIEFEKDVEELRGETAHPVTFDE